MSGPISRTSRFWLLGIIMILAPLTLVGVRVIHKETLPLIEAVFHGGLVLAGVALLDWEIAARLFTRLTHLRRGGRDT
jgi:hypothetical protein